jgi:hypothetical protein
MAKLGSGRVVHRHHKAPLLFGWTGHRDNLQSIIMILGGKSSAGFTIYGDVPINDRANSIAQMTRKALLRVFGSSLLKIKESHLATRPVMKAEMRM